MVLEGGLWHSKAALRRFKTRRGLWHFLEGSQWPSEVYGTFKMVLEASGNLKQFWESL